MIKNSNKIFAACIILLFIVPNIHAVLKGKESFPFTPAPMFSHYIGDHTRFYDFVFIGEGGSKEEVLVPDHPEHKNQLAIKRFFFDKVYGSVEENSPLWDNQNDNKAEFEQRVSDFFSVYFKKLQDGDIKRIRLEVKQYNKKYKETASHVVGSYDFSTKQFKQTWGDQ